MFLIFLFLLFFSCCDGYVLCHVCTKIFYHKKIFKHKVLTLTGSEREDSCQQLLVTAGSSWDAAEYEQYQFGDSEKGTLPLISGRPGSLYPTCGSERVSTYMRHDQNPKLSTNKYYTNDLTLVLDAYQSHASLEPRQLSVAHVNQFPRPLRAGMSRC